jgi:diaminohydroxyphosphoribosylaminopyrimidine deaminase/5-amino-6-(5-phosphoribosylamino)uracil reductase
MQRCLQLAQKGLGHVAPNPLVGAVIVYEGRIIGESWHKAHGQAHAEINAINSVEDKSLLSKSTIYISLEPCSHHGKTPPCADALIKYGFKEVVIACKDPFPKVSGSGIEKLKQAGINVTLGVLEKEALVLNERFITFHTKQRPFVLLKWAQSADGFVDAERDSASKQALKISNEASRSLVHKMRTEEAAIMVGTNTARLDNPQLNARLWPGNNPTRIFIDKSLTLSKKLHLFNNQSKTFVFNQSREEVDTRTHFVKIDFTKAVLPQLLHRLYLENIQSLIVEGGPQLLTSFIEHELWDKAHIITSPQIIGAGVKAVTLAKAAITESFYLQGDKHELFKPLKS